MNEKLKQLRISKAFSQHTLAGILGFKGRAMVCLLEKGKRKPTLSTLLKYSEVFGVSLEEIIK